MDKSKVIYVSGYRSFELGVLKENDPKIQVVKNVLKRTPSVSRRRAGMGTCQWEFGRRTMGCANSSGIEEEYPELSLGILYPFSDFW